MRGTLFIGFAVVLLIVGLLIMKNMGVDNKSANQETQAEVSMEKAKSAVDDVNKRLKDIKKRTRGAD